MRIVGDTLSTDPPAPEAFSAPLAVGRWDTVQIALTARRISGDVPFDIFLQGAWSPSTQSSDWVDTALAETGHVLGLPFRVGDVDEMLWPYCRVGIQAGGPVTVEYRIVELDR